MQKKLLFLLLFLSAMVITGCVSMPEEQLSRAIESPELAEHVHFLAQPALKGRKSQTWESATAREYLTSRFADYGLAPWPGAKGYEQSFGYGTNVIGLLPGSDPSLADEIVILSAHYDHLGTGRKGIYHGACDNASGVAVLLEIAEKLALSEKRPKRSVCFASFDCEEKFLLGSFAFTCREDFEKAQIAAVVNIDLLGRDFLDVVEDALFVVGTEGYPALREGIVQSGRQAGVEILPVGTDLVGPRGDHVAFETMEIPVLFFSCGLYKDYHKPTDTAEKLNYAKMKNSAEVIAETVRALANTERTEKLSQQKYANKDELRTFAYLLEKIESNYDRAGLDAEQGKTVRELATKAKQLLAGTENTAIERQVFLRWVAEDLLPIFVGTGDTCGEKGEGLLCIRELYATHRRVLTEGHRDIIREMLAHDRGLFSKINLKYEAYDLVEEELIFAEAADGEYVLHIFLPHFEMSVEKGGLAFWRDGAGFSLSMKTINCKGSRAQVTDFCLLKWGDNLEDESFSRTWEKVLKKVTATDLQGPYNDWLQWRLKQGGWTDEQQWILDLVESDNPDVVLQAIDRAVKISSEEAKSVIYRLVSDDNVDARVRASAMGHLHKDVGREGLLTLVEALDDDRGRHIDYHFSADKSGPLAEHPCVRWGRRMWEKRYKDSAKSQTLGDLAENKLKQLTKQDFGKDAKAWRKWIAANMK